MRKSENPYIRRSDEHGGKADEYSFEPFYNLNVNGFKEFEVDPENKWFKAVDGVLFSKDGKRLVRYPSAKGLTVYEVPDGCEYFDASSFFNCGSDEGYESIYGTQNRHAYCTSVDGLKEIVIPNSVINYTPDELKEKFPIAACA